MFRVKVESDEKEIAAANEDEAREEFLSELNVEVEPIDEDEEAQP